MVTKITKEHQEQFFTPDLALRNDFVDKVESDTFNNKLRELIIILIGTDLYDKCREKYIEWQKSVLNPKYIPSGKRPYLMDITISDENRKETGYSLSYNSYRYSTKIAVFGSPPSPKALIGLLCLSDKWEFCHNTHDHKLYVAKKLLLFLLLILFIVIVGHLGFA